MKRQGNLFNKMISDTNILRAIKEVNASHRWDKYPTKPNRTTLWVEATKEERVKELKEMILNGFEPHEPTIKRRYDSNARKWREIAEPKLYPDQYIHHIIIQVMQPRMLKSMDPFCCGSIKGRGAHLGIKAIKKWMKYDKSGTRWCAELDIYHFYDSLKPKIVMERLRRLFKDRQVLDLMWRIIKDGIKIGYYTSQWLANTILQSIDHALRQQTKISHGIRYLDNFTLFSNRKRTLRKAIELISDMLGELGLRLKGNYQYFRSSMRLPNALGYRYGRGYTIPRKHNRQKILRTARRYRRMRELGIKPDLHFAQGVLSRLGTLKHCNSTNLYKLLPARLAAKMKAIVRAREVKDGWSIFLEQYEGTALVGSH